MAKSLNVKKGDTVMVIAGSDKGVKGKILYTLPAKNKVVVERVKIAKCHKKPSQANPAGGIIDKEAPVDASNVRLVCPKCSAVIRAKKHNLEDGTVMRRCPDCSEVFD